MSNSEALDARQIDALLQQAGFTRPYDLHLFSSIDSTNRYLKDLPAGSQLALCCAETQTQGRGRFGRTWHSPLGENLYFSSRWTLACPAAKLSGLSLVSSLAVLATLKEYLPQTELAIKWPNDILWQHKKLCGSLIELVPGMPRSQQIIIGIGLNVNFDTLSNPLPDKPWCSLFEISQKRFSRNALLVRLLVHLERYISRFMQRDLSVFMQEWKAVDYLSGKPICVQQAGKLIGGIGMGIDKDGQLLVKTPDNGLLHLSSGECTLQTGR